MRASREVSGLIGFQRSFRSSDQSRIYHLGYACISGLALTYTVYSTPLKQNLSSLPPHLVGVRYGRESISYPNQWDIASRLRYASGPGGWGPLKGKNPRHRVGDIDTDRTIADRIDAVYIYKAPISGFFISILLFSIVLSGVSLATLFETFWLVFAQLAFSSHTLIERLETTTTLGWILS